MTNRINYRYSLHTPIQAQQVGSNPSGVSVAMRDDYPTVWLEVDEGSPTQLVTFYVVDTGKPVSPSLFFVGRAVDDSRGLVFNIYSDVPLLNSSPLPYPQALSPSSVKKAVLPPESISQLPERGAVVRYRKENGEENTYFIGHIEFIEPLNGRQRLLVWDVQDSQWKTFYADNILNFPTLVL